VEIIGRGLILNTVPTFTAEIEENYEKSYLNNPGEILTGRFTNTSRK
jgi:hypothetical protein